jgi:large subunit ribosomal protein L24
MRRKHNLIPKLHLKKGDNVKVLSGDDRGKTGRVLVVNPSKQTAIVEGINMMTKHAKPNQTNPNGERRTEEAPIRVAKLQVVDPKTGEGSRIGRTLSDKGWVRIAKKSGAKLD